MLKKSYLIFLISLLCVIASAQADPNLLCEYTFDEQTAEDSSGNGHHGTIMGNAAIVYDANRSSYVSYFPTGTNGDYIDCGGGGDWASPGGDDATISMWLKTENGFPRTYAFAANVEGIWRVSSYGANMRLYHLPTGGNLRGTNDTVGNDQWHHVAGTYDGSTRILYIDGKIDVSDSQSGPLRTSSNPFLIGGGYAAGSSCWRGYIDDVRFYTRALPQKELLEVAGINHAINQSPDGQTGLGAEVQLSWMAAYSESRYYNVYYGTDSDSVAGSQPGALLGDTVLILDHDDTTLTQTFEYGTTYYWRVDVVDGATVYPDEGIYTFTIAPANSHDFLPSDGLVDLPASTVVFMWTPGAAPIDGYNIYLGTSPTNLTKENAALLTEPNYVPTLANSTTYYWKVEDVATTTISSPVMSFSTADEIDPTLVGWWKFNEGSGNIALDYSGNGNNGTIYNAGYTDGILGSSLNLVRANQCYVDIPPAAFADLTNEVTFSFWTYGGEALPVNTVFFQATAVSTGGRVLGCHLPYINSSVPNVHFDVGDGDGYDNIRKPAEESEFKGQWNHWVFTKDAVAGEMKMYLNGNLWHSGGGLYRPIVPVDKFYIGGRTSDGTVNWDGLVDDFRVYNRPLSGVEIRELYWEVNPPDYLLIDDMESYNDTTNPINGMDGWLDGYGPTGYTSLAKASNLDPAILEQSLKFNYDNDYWIGTGTSYNSECVKTLDSPVNLTEDNLAFLTINFYGSIYNVPEKFYVALEDDAGVDHTVYHPEDDPNFLLTESWQTWEIPLTDFTGVDLTQVRKIYIGCGTRGDVQYPNEWRYGAVYIDDVTVNPPACRPDIQKPAADLTDDCVVDIMDVQAMANDWLIHDVTIIPQTIDDTNLVACWNFDDLTANDSTGNGNNGTLISLAAVENDPVRGNVLKLDGIDSYVQISDFDYTNSSNEFTMCFWFKTNGPVVSAEMPYMFNHGSGAEYASNNLDVYVRNNDGRLTSRIILDGQGSSSSTRWQKNTPGIYDDSQWHSYAITLDSDGLATAYVDGIVTNSSIVPGAGNAMNPLQDILLGARNISGTIARFFDGMLDDVRIYNRTLSREQIVYVAYNDTLIIPIDTSANISVAGTPGQEIVNYKDFSVIADTWLEEILWP